VTATLTPGSTNCRPRYATPRDESFPTHGPAVAAIAEKLGRPLMPWQRDLANVAYEYDPVTGLYRYNEVDITVPRQSGKTTLVLAKKVFRCTAAARQLGPQRATYTAQKRLNARRKLERDFAELLRGSRSFREIQNAKARPQRATEWRLSLNNGSEAIQFGTGSFLQIDTPSRTGGHGDTLDDGTIDEAFAHVDDTVEAGMRPAMATRKNSQIWVISTAGDGQSAYLYRKVLAGRVAAESDDHGSVCVVEYSAPDDADPGDPAVWWANMPALGITITEEFIRGEWERAQRKGQEGVDMFRRAYLNQWPEVPALGEAETAGAFPADTWKALADPATERGSGVSFGLATAPDRAWAAIAVAWKRDDGNAHVMLADYRPTTTWVKERAKDLTARWGGEVRVDTASRNLLDDAVALSRPEEAMAQSAMRDRVTARTVRHDDEPALNTAVRAAEWRNSGDTQVLERRGSADISPLVAAALALNGIDDGGVQFW
jgi:phage terminase large subunit-like protein